MKFLQLLCLQVRHGARVLEFVDNGHTGTNFERPAFQEMLKLVRIGKVHCILCKDFSRFGRNILETGYFIEQVFPLYGVRFIAVTDKYDSIDYKGNTGGLDVAFKFLIHEYYSKDLSKKVRTAKRIKMINGESITENCLYGYTKGESGKLEIDESAAMAIRLIYKMALAGDKTSKIRDALCTAKYPTPAEHKAMRRRRTVTPRFLWASTMVADILHNEQYTGTYISGKRNPKDIGEKYSTKADESQWIKIPNHHPAIISKDDFLRVQEKYPKKKRTEVRKPRDYLLFSKVFCGCCQKAMRYNVSKNPIFHCTNTYADPAAECHMLKILTSQLDEAVLSTIRKQAEIVLNLSDISELQKVSADEQSLAECEQQIRQQTERRQEYYERFVHKEIDAEVFRSFRYDCAKQLERLNSQLTLLKQAQRSKEVSANVAALAKESLCESALPKDVVNALVDKIRVFPDNQIEILWKFENFAPHA